MEITSHYFHYFTLFILEKSQNKSLSAFHPNQPGIISHYFHYVFSGILLERPKSAIEAYLQIGILIPIIFP